MSFLKNKVIDWYNLTLEDRFDKMASVKIKIDNETKGISGKNPFSLSETPMLYLKKTRQRMRRGDGRLVL